MRGTKIVLSIFILFISCAKESKKIKLNLLFQNTFTTINIDSLDSKMAFNKNILLLKKNEYYHSIKDISASKTFLLRNGKLVATNQSYENLLKKYKLTQIKFNTIFSSKNDSIPPSLKNNEIIFHKKNGFKNVIKVSNNKTLFQYYQHITHKKAKLNISTKSSSETFTFNIKGYNPSISLFDINGDGKEELFIYEVNDDYLGKDFLLKIYEVNIY